jgi:hypothetical protein
MKKLCAEVNNCSLLRKSHGTHKYIFGQAAGLLNVKYRGMLTTVVCGL